MDKGSDEDSWEERGKRPRWRGWGPLIRLRQGPGLGGGSGFSSVPGPVGLSGERRGSGDQGESGHERRGVDWR